MGGSPDGQGPTTAVRAGWKQRVGLLLLNLSIGNILVVGAQHYHDCAAVPDLTLYLVLTGSLGLINGLAKAWWAIPVLPSQQTLNGPTILTHILTAVFVAVAVGWGLILTVPPARKGMWGGTKAHGGCSALVFNSALVTAAISTTITTIIFTATAASISMRWYHGAGRELGRAGSDETLPLVHDAGVGAGAGEPANVLVQR